MSNKRYGSDAERQAAYRERKKSDGMMEALPWPYNEGKAARWGEGVTVYVKPTREEVEAMGMLSEKVFTIERSLNRDGMALRCALPTCGKVFTTTLPLMRFCCCEHQVERLEQLDTRGGG